MGSQNKNCPRQVKQPRETCSKSFQYEQETELNSCEAKGRRVLSTEKWKSTEDVGKTGKGLIIRMYWAHCVCKLGHRGLLIVIY